jgi:hypothetical protein
MTEFAALRLVRAHGFQRHLTVGEASMRHFFQRLRSGSFLCLVLLATTSALAGGTKQTPKEAKGGVYISMINSESNHLLDNYERYVRRVKDLEKGPTCKEVGAQQWLSSMGPSAPDRVAAYRKGLAKQPKLEVDAAALQMVDALDALYKPVGEASDYYFMSKFNKDNCKRGDELHPILMSGWTKYIQAEHLVREYLDKYTDERDTAELTLVQKKFGKALHYYQQKLMIDAKALIRVSNVKEPNLTIVSQRLATFATTLSEAKAIVEKSKKGKDADALYQGGYEQLLTKAGWLKDASDRVVVVVSTEAKDPKAAATTNSRPNAMQNLITAYNDLVEQSNQTMYSKTMK